MALSMCKVWFNGIKIAFFSKKLQKIAGKFSKKLQKQLEASPPDPRLWCVWVTLAFSKRLHQSYVFALFNYISLSLSVCKILVKCQQANFWWCHCMWFVVSASPIKNSGYADKLEIARKTFLKTFFLENTCCCVLGPWPWPRAFLSLASRGSVLGKAVLGLGFFCVLGLGLEPCVLDSTSGHSNLG